MKMNAQAVNPHISQTSSRDAARGWLGQGGRGIGGGLYGVQLQIVELIRLEVMRKEGCVELIEFRIIRISSGKIGFGKSQRFGFKTGVPFSKMSGEVPRFPQQSRQGELSVLQFAVLTDQRGLIGGLRAGYPLASLHILPGEKG